MNNIPHFSLTSRCLSRRLAFKQDINKVRETTFRLGAFAPPEYLTMLQTYPEIVDEVTNGVGSETMGISFHLTPDTVCGMNINMTSHIHDWMNTFPLYFPSVADGLLYKLRSEQFFNINGHLQAADGVAILRPIRNSIINADTRILSTWGGEAFWANKPLPPDYDVHYTKQPTCDTVKLARLMEIEQIINDVCPEYIPYTPQPATA